MSIQPSGGRVRIPMELGLFFSGFEPQQGWENGGGICGLLGSIHSLQVATSDDIYIYILYIYIYIYVTYTCLHLPCFWYFQWYGHPKHKK